MNWYIYRNNTVERFFGSSCQFSGYEDVSVVPTDVDGYIWFYQMPTTTDSDLLAAQIKSYLNGLNLVISKTSANKLFVALTMEDLFSAGVVSSDRLVENARAEYNNFLFQKAKEGRIKTIDFSDFTKRYGQEDLIDWKFYFLTQIGLNPRLAGDFKQWFDKRLDSIALKRKKCLVLDLDNTLWGGVLGEDGVEGIKCSGDYPGKAFHWWQEALLSLSKSGVILAICSKNNLADVEDLWAKNPNLVLRKEHFAAWRINWQDKATNLQELAAELNIGLDSMVFVDDNPTERELIKQMLSMVAVPDFPTQPYDLPILYKSLIHNYFKVYSLTDEDRQKTAQYRANAERKQAEASFSNFDDYLRSLQIELTIKPADSFSIPRIAQMTQKTNQFNLTTRRYTEADIQNLIANGAKIYTLSVKDRFGDNGITGLTVIQDSAANCFHIDTLLLSCRVLGKGIEKAFVNYVLAQLQKEGIERLEADYFRTLKNAQVADFYDRCGFTLVSEVDNAKHYTIDLTAYQSTENNIYKIN